MSPATTQEALRALPSVEETLHALGELIPTGAIPRQLVTDAVRDTIARMRERILAGETLQPSVEMAMTGTLRTLQAHFKPSLRRVVNATGVIVHTNLGRSALAPAALQAVQEAASGYSTLEYDTTRMERGSRHEHYESLICTLTGAEGAMAVNNNAAAVMLVLSEFASGHEAVVSRGELVEIGGSFRIPDIMQHSQAKMVEVGTTNKTHPADYEHAIGPDTAMLLKVHTSNYCVLGFTETVEGHKLRELADIANARRAAGEAPATTPGPILVYEDLGSGLLQPLEGLESYNEPTVAEALAAGCDLVSFSGDKLLGGPQAGIVVGRKELIERLKRNPLARALRLDKMTLAALEATLRLYLDPEAARKQIPTLRLLSEPVEATRERAKALAHTLRRCVPKGCCTLSVVDDVARAGGGSLPLYDIPSAAVEVTFARGDAQSCMEYLVQEHSVPVVGRIHHERLLLNARCLLDEDDVKEAAGAVTAYFEHMPAVN